MITLLTVLFLNIAPVVSITSHVTNQIVQSGEITIKANATDADGKIMKVVFYVNTTTVGTALKAPFTTTVNLTPGKYTLKARAYDNSGSYRTASVTINVQDLATVASNSIQTLTTRVNALEAELKTQKDSITSLRKLMNIQDTVIYDPDRFQVNHETPTRHRIKLK